MSFKSLSLLADRCTSMPQLKQVHAKMIMTSRILDNYAASRLLAFAALSPSGDLPHAVLLFRHTKAPNSFMWNTLIRAFAESHSPFDAFYLFVEMLRLGFPPGKHTFPFLLKACAVAGFDGTLDVSLQVHSLVVKYGLDLDLYVVNGLIRCYGCSGQLSNARVLFDEMPERNSVVWTTMISAYAQNFCADDALLLFDRMRGEGVEPCDATMSSVLSACARSSRGLEVGRQIHLFLEERGIELGVILGTALVDMYAKNGVVLTSLELFRKMREKNIATWNAVICGLAHHGHASTALQLFQELETQEEVQPNDITFVGVLTACCHTGLLDEGRRLFALMSTKYHVEPKVQHYGCMVDLLGRKGELAEAEELIKGMRWRPDIVVLGALLTACRNHRNVEIAERVVSEMLKLDPNNHGVYVVLSNMYAEAGRWQDVARCRKVMKDGQLQKIPGQSCVNGDAR